MHPRFTETVMAEACKMIEKGKSQQEILAHLISAAEEVAGGNAVSSILVLDDQGLLRNGVSPRLPKDYLAAIDGIKPDPNVGTCAATAATGCMTITIDFMDDSKWTELRHLPLALGFVGAWSMPIKTLDGKVLGTFGTYFREKRVPGEDEIQAIRCFSDIAARVLGNRNCDT